MELNNYYPFGLKHGGYNPTSGNSSYQYKYNGKELQTDSGMYDYGARFYMPDLGRWGIVDPLAETSRRHIGRNIARIREMRGATGYSTEVSGSYFVGGAHSFSTKDNSPSRADYGTQATSFNLGTGYDAGVSRTFTKDITKQVNNAPSAVSNWLRKNIKYSPQFN